MPMSKCLVMFVEGETEIEFYKMLISIIRSRHSKGILDTKILYKNLKGIGGYKKEANRKFKKDVIVNNQGYDFTVALCRDTDVFDFAQKPKINWNSVEQELKVAGAKRVIHIQAVKAIEDWFLYDLEGICSYLKIPKTKPVGKNGYAKLGYLFKKTNRVYLKGRLVKGFVEQLDMDKITDQIKEEISPIYKMLGVRMK